jgi:hypothetical protein
VVGVVVSSGLTMFSVDLVRCKGVDLGGVSRDVFVVFERFSLELVSWKEFDLVST